MTLSGAPLTTLSAMNNGAIHFPSMSFVVNLKYQIFYMVDKLKSKIFCISE